MESVQAATDSEATGGAEGSVAATRRITVTKKWVGDNESVRPEDIKIHLKKSEAVLKKGQELSVIMKVLSGDEQVTGPSHNGPNDNPPSDNMTIAAFRRATEAQYSQALAAGATIENVSESGEAVYFWFDNGVIFYYSKSDNIYMNSDSAWFFASMRNLTDISGVSTLNTAYVTSMRHMFVNCTSLVDLSPLAAWDTGNVTTMRFMFGFSEFNTYDTDSEESFMSYNDLAPLANWNTQGVIDMNCMFRNARSIKTLEPIGSWNVANLISAASMFNRTEALEDASAIRGWDVRRVGGEYAPGDGTVQKGSFMTMFQKSGVLASDSLPNFALRAGSWNNGTFVPDNEPLMDSVPVVTKIKDITNERVIGGDGVRWAKDGNIWVASVDVSNDGSVWKAWEETENGSVKAKGAGAYVESSEGREGYGKDEANAVRGITKAVEFTNVYNAKATNVVKNPKTAGESYAVAFVALGGAIAGMFALVGGLTARRIVRDRK
ncbi:BspA family leucine-rich repeat surface protein [Candidatus Saccharibacteria bacterium]|nr:BspA family leucine-rich repeat surface protein [Candidatus Saccharibacteria bacterium]